MPRRYLFKSPAFLTGSGVVGTGAISIGGWQFAEDFYPYGGEQLAKQGFSENIPKPELEVSVEKGEHKTGESPFKFQSYGCFQNFFPGVTVNHSVVDAPHKEDSFTLPNKTDIVSDHNPIGCALMNFSYEVETGTEAKGQSTKIKYVFKSEVTVKNDKFGWALWAGSKKLPTTGVSGSALNERADYYLIFLKKDDADKWNILGGYSWTDVAIFSGSAAANMNIRSPNGDGGNWYDPISNAGEGTSNGSNEYSGIWEATKGTGNEIFQEIELWAGRDDEKYANNEILGRGFKTGSSDVHFNKGYNSFGYEEAWYVYSSDTGWTKMSNYKDITQTLNDMYFPFKGKKGSWRKTEEYCSSHKSSRIYWKDIYKLQNFCYKK